jgi:HEAT repeat protein
MNAPSKHPSHIRLRSPVLSRESVHLLERELEDPDQAIAIRAANALAAGGSAETSAALGRHLGRGCSEVQAIVEDALADRHRPDPVPFIDWMMGSDEPVQQAAAIRVIGRMRNPQALPLLRELARSTSIALRSEAVRAVAEIQENTRSTSGASAGRAM